MALDSTYELRATSLLIYVGTKYKTNEEVSSNHTCFVSSVLTKRTTYILSLDIELSKRLGKTSVLPNNTMCWYSNTDVLVQ